MEATCGQGTGRVEQKFPTGNKRNEKNNWFSYVELSPPSLYYWFVAFHVTFL